jgi:hypothetical protein
MKSHKTIINYRKQFHYGKKKREKVSAGKKCSKMISAI